MISHNQMEELTDDFIREPILVPSNEPVIIMAADHAEKLICRICGKEYVSSGKYDPGICRACRREDEAMLVGGPLDGEKAHP